MPIAERKIDFATNGVFIVMRKSVCLFLCGTALACVFPVSATAANGQIPQAKYRPPDNVTMIELRGTSEAGGLTGRFAMIVDLRSGRYVAQRDYDIYSEAIGFDGRLGWKRDRSGASHFLDSDPARAITATEAWLFRRGWCEGENGATRVESRPDEKNGEVTEAVWNVTPKGGIPVLLRFEKANGLLHQSEVSLWSSRLVRHYSDWRGIDGVFIPFAEKDEYPEDESVELIKIESAKVNPRNVDAKIFERPPNIHDYAINGDKISTTVPYEDDGVGRIFVPVFIDDKGPYPFEIDTGGHLILTSATAEKLKLKPIGNASATGGGTGVMHQGTVRAKEIRIGDAVIRDQPVWVIPLPDSSNDRGPRAPRAGFLGLELFERFTVQLNRKAKAVTLTLLEKFDGKAQGVRLPIYFTEDAPLTRGSFNGVSGDFELDSGNAGPAIIEGYWAHEHDLESLLARGLPWAGSGVGGDYGEKLSHGDIALGPIKLPHEVVSCAGLVQRGSESTKLQAGVVGESSLYQFDMVYDYAREQVWIDPKANVPHRAFNRAGLRLKKEKPNAFTVAFVAPNSPAETAGIKNGDQILSINEKPALHLSYSDAVVIFSQSEGTKITLLVSPKAGGSTRRAGLRLKELLP
jgi:aspartyl protease/PDZ domain-containing protein